MGHADASRIMHAKKSGFTLIEVLAAMMFLAILVPVVVSALSLSSRISSLSDRRAVAAELAENKLNEELTGNYWVSGNTSKGDFGADYPGYTWELTQTGWDGSSTTSSNSLTSSNSMTELAMTVTFPVQGRDQTVKLTTLASASLAQQINSGTTGQSSSSTSSTSGAQAAPLAPTTPKAR